MIPRVGASEETTIILGVYVIRVIHEYMSTCMHAYLVLENLVELVLQEVNRALESGRGRADFPAPTVTFEDISVFDHYRMRRNTWTAKAQAEALGVLTSPYLQHKGSQSAAHDKIEKQPKKTLHTKHSKNKSSSCSLEDVPSIEVGVLQPTPDSHRNSLPR